jgi:hypothetical protein
LAVAVRHYPARLTWGQLAALAGRKARGGHFNTEKKRLLDGGLIRDEGEAAVPTAAGLDAAGGMPELPADLADAYLAALPGPADRMLRELIARPQIAASALASALGMKASGGHWNSGLATLARCGLITKSGAAITLNEEALRG